MASMATETESISKPNIIQDDNKVIHNCSNLVGYKAIFSNGAIFRLFLNKDNSEEICNNVEKELKKNNFSSINVYEFKFPHKETKIDIYRPLEKIPDKNNPDEQFEKVWNDEQQRYYVKRYYKYKDTLEMKSDISSVKDWPHLPISDNKSNDEENKLSKKINIKEKEKKEKEKPDSGYVEKFIQNFGNLQNYNKKNYTKFDSTKEINIKKKSQKSIIPENKKHFINLINKEINKMYTVLQEKTDEYSKLLEQTKNSEKKMNDYTKILQEKKSEFELYIRKIEKQTTNCEIISNKDKNKKFLEIHDSENDTIIKILV